MDEVFARGGAAAVSEAGPRVGSAEVTEGTDAVLVFRLALVTDRPG